MIELNVLEEKLIVSLDTYLKNKGTKCYAIRIERAQAQRMYLEIPKAGRVYYDRQKREALFVGRILKSYVSNAVYTDDKGRFGEDGFIQACKNVLDAWIEAVEAAEAAVANLIAVEAEANRLPF